MAAMADKLLLLVLFLRCMIASGNHGDTESCSGSQYLDVGGRCTSCPEQCSDSMGNNYCTGPEGMCVGRCGVYTEDGGAVPILSGVGLDVEDDDHNEVFMMQRAIIEVVTRDTTDFQYVVLDAPYLANGVIASYQNGVLNLDGEASVADYTGMLRHITFDISSAEPDLSSRRILFKIFDGLFWSDPAYVTVSIQPINDNAPELSLVPMGVAYVEGRVEGVGLLSDVVLMDVDHNGVFNLTALHINISDCSSSEDIIVVEVPENLDIVTAMEGGCLILTGSAPVQTYREIIRSARYLNSAEEPDPSDREISFIVFDGNFSASDSLTLQIEVTDDNPTMVVNTVVDQLSYTEGAPPEPVGFVIVLTDVDSANSNVSVNEVVISVESEEEMLYLQETHPDITVDYLADGSIVLSGTAALGNYERLLQNLSYSVNATLEPPCPLNRSIEVVLSGGEHPSQNVTPPLIVDVIPVNDNRPVVTLADTRLSRNETGPPILAFQDLTLSDLDNTSCNRQLFVAARVVVEKITNDSDSDVLAITDSSVQIRLEQPPPRGDCSFPYPAVTPVAADADLVWYTCRDSGRLILAIEGPASIGDYQLLLQSVTYFNAAQEPDKDTLTRSLSVIVADESLVSKSQSVAINIQLENDEPPVISETPNTQTFFEEGGPIDLFDFTVTLSDADNCFDHSLTQEIRVSLLNPVETEDVLLVNGSALSRFDVSYSCNEEDEPACYEEFLLSLQYNNTNREPVSFNVPRRFSIEAFDFARNSAPFPLTVVIELVNDNEPILMLDGVNMVADFSITYFERQPYLSDPTQIMLSRTLAIFDGDVGVQMLVEANITILQGDVASDLVFLSQFGEVFAAQFGIEVTVVDPHTLRLTGQAAQGDYGNILSEVMYENIADEPGNVTREVLFTIVDEDGFINTATSTVSIIPTNDQAIINFAGGPRNLVYDEFSKTPINLFNESDTITDSDGSTLEWLTIHLTPGVDPNDVLAADAGDRGLTVTVNTTSDGEILLNISGNADLSTYESVLNSVTFVNIFPGIVSDPPRRLDVMTFDGETASAVHPITITIGRFNDPPMCFFMEVATPTSSARFIEESPPIPVAEMFNLADLDSPDLVAMQFAVTVMIMDAVDGDTYEGLLFDITGTGVRVTTLTNNDLFSISYNLEGSDTYSAYQNVIRTARYFNNQSQPNDRVTRRIIITIPDVSVFETDIQIYNRTFSPCEIQVTVVNVPDSPMVNLPEGYNVSFIEDGSEIFPLNSSRLTITDEDNSFVLQANINIENADTLQASVSDQLIAVSTDSFRVSGSGTTALFVEAIGFKRLITTHRDFMDYLRGVAFTTDDQAPDVVRNLSIVVQEFPVGEAAKSFTFIPIHVLPINDQPVLLSSQVTEAPLTDYFPQDVENLGFNASFLLSPSDVQDVDRQSQTSQDFIGLAIIGQQVPIYLGGWQYRGDNGWVDFPLDMSLCNPLLVGPSTPIRFSPSPNPAKEDGNADITFQAWDGSSDEDSSCVTPVDRESSISADSLNFTYIVTYLNRAPVIESPLAEFPNISEDTSSSDNQGTRVSVLADLVANDSDDAVLGLAVIQSNQSNGMWQYRAEGELDWTSFPDSINEGYLQQLNSTTSVRFVPNQHFFGQSQFAARAWDMSNENTNNGIVSVTSSGEFSGPYSSERALIRINIVHINDLPVIVLGIGNITFTESAPPVRIFPNLGITDVDGTELLSATLVLECPSCSVEADDNLFSFSGMSSDILASDVILSQNATGPFRIVQVSDTSFRSEFEITPVAPGDRDIIRFTQYLQTLHFVNQDQEPMMEPRSISLSVSDGVDSSAAVTVVISIQLMNDETPSVTLPFEVFTYTENSGRVLLFSPAQGPRVEDDDQIYPISSAYVRFTGGNLELERVTVNCLLNPELLCISSQGMINITGEAGMMVYSQVLGSLSYQNNAEEPDTEQREVTFAVDDGRFTSPEVSLEIRIELINDLLPVITPPASSVLFLEENPTSPPVAIATNLTVADPDNGAFLVASVQASLTNPLDEGFERIGLRRNLRFPPFVEVDTSDPYLAVISVQVGAVSMNGDPVSGLTPALVQRFLQGLRYMNSAEQPSGESRTIEVVVSDNFTFSGLQDSIPAVITVNFELTDDLPVVELNAGVVIYSEGQTLRQVTVAPNAIVEDIDNVNISGLVIELIAQASGTNISQEILRVALPTGGFVAENETSTESGQRLILTGEASVEVYTAVLRSLTYEHNIVAGDPDSGIRLIVVTPVGLNGESGISDEVTIAFNVTDNPPLLDLNGQSAPGRNFVTVFVEESGPVSVTTPDLVLQDVDSVTLEFVQITLFPNLDEEALLIELNSSSITIEQNSTSSILLLGMSSPVQDFASLLTSLQYVNFADEPSVEARNVIITVSDGNGLTEQSTLINIELVNDAPDVFLNGSQLDSLVTFVENGAAVPLSNNPQVTDSDSQQLTLRIRPLQDMTGDVISANTDLYFNQAMGYYFTNTSYSPADLAATISSVVFQSLLAEPEPGDRVFCFSVFDDQQLPSGEACSRVILSFVNDNSPTFEQPIYSAAVEENTPNTNFVTVMATDLDSFNTQVQLTYNIVSGDDCMQSFSIGSGELMEGSGTSLAPISPQPCRFVINSMSGQISTTDSPPDREQRDSYLLLVVVSDGTNEGRAYVNITIDDVVDEAPRFQPAFYEFTIPLGAEAGLVLAQLRVIDQDADENVMIFLMTQDPSRMSVFDVESSGRVSLLIPESELDAEVATLR